MIVHLKPTGKETPFTLNFGISCYTCDELFEDLKELCTESAIKRISITFSPLNGFIGSAVTNYHLSQDFIEKYNLKFLKK